jgi:hypothetical protein
MRRPNAKDCGVMLQYDFWGTLWIKIFRDNKDSKVFNKNQSWIRAVIPIRSNISLLKI